jgi:ribose-phosphate pyrophosphokinase
MLEQPTNNQYQDLLILGLDVSADLAKDIAKNMNMPLGDVLCTKFNDGETRIEIHSHVRGKDVFVVQSTCNPANEHLMNLILLVDALHRSSVNSISLVLPYFGYARQDRKIHHHSPISASVVATLLQSVGNVKRILSIDLHSATIAGFFDIPLEQLSTKHVFGLTLKNLNLANPIVVSPDVGGVARARSVAQNLHCGLAIVDKRRDQPGESKVMHLIGDVAGKDVILVDDLVDTGGSLIQAADMIKSSGANRIFAAITHPVFSKDAITRIENSCIETMFVSDTIPCKHRLSPNSNIQVVSVASFLAQAIHTIYTKNSFSSHFK